MNMHTSDARASAELLAKRQENGWPIIEQLSRNIQGMECRTWLKYLDMQPQFMYEVVRMEGLVYRQRAMLSVKVDIGYDP